MSSVSSRQTPTPEPAWYKQFWPWFLIALPAAAVVACVYTIYVAVLNRDSLVTDDYYRIGVTINTALAEMDMAETLGVTAQLEPVREQRVVLQLPEAVAPEELQLMFRHPTQAGKDFSINLLPQQNAAGSKTYSGEVSEALDGRWMVVLAPADGLSPRWRLEATWREPSNHGLALGH